jgi:hypothetical protein
MKIILFRPNRFFWWCAGADIEVLEHCPTEHRKFTTVGAIIFIVACIASFSMFFAISTVIKDYSNPTIAAYDVVVSDSTKQIITDTTKILKDESKTPQSPPLLPSQGLSNTVFAMRIGFSLLWGILILLIDRLMVSTINPWDSDRKKLIKAIPRFVLALIIAMVISRPIEIQIFWDEIQAKVFENNSKKFNEESQRKSEVYGILTNQDQLKIFQKTQDSINKKISLKDYGPIYTNLLIEKTDYSNKLDDFQSKINQYEANKKGFRGSKNAQGQALTKIDGDLVWVDVKVLVAAEDRKINAVKSKMNVTGYPVKLEKIQNSIDSIEKKWSSEQSKNSELLARTVKEIADAKSNLYKFQQGQENVLSNKQYSFSANLDGLSTLDGSTGYAVWFIFLLFLVLEILPITVKLMTPAGNFDDFIREKEKYDKINFTENLKTRNKIFQNDLKKWELEKIGIVTESISLAQPPSATEEDNDSSKKYTNAPPPAAQKEKPMEKSKKSARTSKNDNVQDEKPLKKGKSLISKRHKKAFD